MRNILRVGLIYVMARVEYLVLSDIHDILGVVDGQTSHTLITHYA